MAEKTKKFEKILKIIKNIKKFKQEKAASQYKEPNRGISLDDLVFGKSRDRY